MKKVQETKEGGFYIFKGRSNANSCFIEKIIHAKQFLLYANHFLKGYLSIYDYLITKDGWVLVIKVKSELKKQKSIINEDVWLIISERIRLFLSTFVRVTNKQRGRTGCLVHSSYERYCFETLKEAMKYINRIRNQQIKLYSGRKKYRGVKTHYKISASVGKGSVFLCSKDVKKRRLEFNNMKEVFEFIDLKETVVLKMLDFTFSSHNFNIPHSISPSKPKNEP